MHVDVLEIDGRRRLMYLRCNFDVRAMHFEEVEIEARLETAVARLMHLDIFENQLDVVEIHVDVLKIDGCILDVRGMHFEVLEIEARPAIAMG